MARGGFLESSPRPSSTPLSATLAGRAAPADFLARSPGADVSVFFSDAMAVGGALHGVAANMTPKGDLRYHGRGCAAIARAVAAKEGTEACCWASSPMI